MIYLAIFLLLAGHAVCDSGMDAIKDRRTHMGLHPYKDAWHAGKHLSRACLIGLGYCVALTADKMATVIVLIPAIVLFYFLWLAVYRQADYWFALDQTVKLGTGWKWLDKFLGFHH